MKFGMLLLKKGYEKQLNSQGKTPWSTLGAQIYVNSKDNPRSIFAKTDTRRKKFYLKSMAQTIDLDDTSISDELISKKKKIAFLEKDLHKYLTYYAYYHLHCYTKTIRHHICNKKEFGEWVHPDMVGCYFSMDDWKKEVYDFSNSIGVRPVVLYSFELKRELNFRNLRESFFNAYQIHLGQTKHIWSQQMYRKTKIFLKSYQDCVRHLELALLN